MNRRSFLGKIIALGAILGFGAKAAANSPKPFGDTNIYWSRKGTWPYGLNERFYFIEVSRESEYDAAKNIVTKWMVRVRPYGDVGDVRIADTLPPVADGSVRSLISVDIDVTGREIVIKAIDRVEELPSAA